MQTGHWHTASSRAHPFHAVLPETEVPTRFRPAQCTVVTVAVHPNPIRGRLLRLLWGGGQDIIVDRLRREFSVTCEVGAPQVNYRESISREADVVYTHKKQSGGAGQFAQIAVRFQPGEPQSGFTFCSEIKGGAVSAPVRCRQGHAAGWCRCAVMHERPLHACCYG